MNSTKSARFAFIICLLLTLSACGGDGGILKTLSNFNPNPVGNAAMPQVSNLASESICPVAIDDAETKAKTVSNQKVQAPHFAPNFKVFDTVRKVHSHTHNQQLTAFSADDEVTVFPSQEFIGLKKNGCVMSAEWYKKINVTHEPKAHPTLRWHAFNFQVKQLIQLKAFEGLAQSERCLLSVSAVDTQSDKLMAAVDWTSADPQTDSQKWLSDIKLPEALDEFFHEDYGIKQDAVVAVLDTGVYFFHEDLGGDNVWKQPNGLIGYNAPDPDLDALDSGVQNGAHGSNIAGLISGIAGNDKGIAGMFPRNIKLMALKMAAATGGTGTTADRYNAFEFGAANGADVINMSFSFGYADKTFQQMIKDFTANGGFVAVSAGNDGKLVKPSSNKYPVAWAYGIDGMMSVGATQAGTERLAGFSNYGTQAVDIIAPGGGVLTTNPLQNGQWVTDRYARISGTSFSSPIVAGAAGMVVALLKTHNIAYTAKDIEEIMAEGARSVTGLKSYANQGRFLDMKKLAETVFEKYPEIKAGAVDEPIVGVPVPEVVCP